MVPSWGGRPHWRGEAQETSEARKVRCAGLEFCRHRQPLCFYAVLPKPAGLELLEQRQTARIRVINLSSLGHVNISAVTMGYFLGVFFLLSKGSVNSKALMMGMDMLTDKKK